MLVYFTLGRKVSTEAPVIVGETTIQPVKKAKYLGITFDQNLKYKMHLDQVVAKGTKFAMAITGIARDS